MQISQLPASEVYIPFFSEFILPVTTGHQALLIAEEMSKFNAIRAHQMISSYISFKEEVIKLLQFAETRMIVYPSDINVVSRFEYDVPVQLDFDPIKSLVKIDNKIQTLQQFIKDKNASVQIVPSTVKLNVWHAVVSDIRPHEA